MSEAAFQIAQDLQLESDIGSAAMRLSPTIAVYEALCAGNPVQRDKLEANVLARISEPADGPPIVLDIHLAHRIEANMAVSSNGHHITETDNPVKVIPLDQFIAVKEDIAPPLIGTDDDALLPSEGLLFMYGDGGAGKTTLSIDAMAHLAAGVDWLTNTVQRPLRTLLIENEGPRGPFRQTLSKKVAVWEGQPFAPQCAVLEEPWTRFTLAEAAYREGLARQIDFQATDLVIVGPLASLGARGTGTPDDVTDFSILISDLRARASRPFALWIVHHENKQGDVSGAWERLPDTLIHVSAQGNGRTRVAWRKVRWSSRLHNTAVTLLWDNGGFTLEEARQRDLRAELLDQVGEAWVTATEAGRLINANADKVRDELQVLAGEGHLEFAIGPTGRSPKAKCWRLRSTYSDLLSESESVGGLTGNHGPTHSPTRPIEESVRSESVSQSPPTHSADAESVEETAPEPELDW